jgi:tetratricopeptide (TPR) repeat protein
MLATDPQNRTARRDLATSQARAAQTLSAAEQGQESLELFSQAAAGFETLVTGSPANGDLRYMAGNTLTLMAVRFRSAGDSAQALDRVRRAIQHLTAPAASGNPNILDQLAASRALAALLLAEKGDRAGALEEAGKAAEIPASGPGSDTKFRGSGTNYWSRVGEMFEALARKKDAAPDQRLADWRSARDAYQRSIAALRQSVQIRRELGVPELESKIANCEKEIAGLTH